jgi:hypothetical protein
MRTGGAGGTKVCNGSPAGRTLIFFESMLVYLNAHKLQRVRLGFHFRRHATHGLTWPGNTLRTFVPTICNLHLSILVDGCNKNEHLLTVCLSVSKVASMADFLPYNRTMNSITIDPTKIPMYPPPPGVVSNFDNPHTYRKESEISHAILLSFATLAAIVRLYTRAWIKGKLQIDDYFIMLSWALSANFSGWCFAALSKGLGRHLWDISVAMFLDVGKYLFITQLLYLPTTLAIRLSVLICYQNIFCRRNLASKIWIWVGIVVCSVFYVVVFFCTLFQCEPIAKAYNRALPGKCISYAAFPWINGVFNVVSDLYIMVFPIPFVWTLRMEMGRKLRLLAVFGLGFL